MDLDKYLDKAEEFINTYDFNNLFNLLSDLKYYIPIPSNYEYHSTDNWFELEDNETLKWNIPNIDVLKHIIFDITVNSLYNKDNYNFGPFCIIYNKDTESIDLDLSEFIEELDWVNKKFNEYQDDIKYVLPGKSYVGNCSKEFCEIIVEKYWEREYERIQYIDFPLTSFKRISEKGCINEIQTLLKTNIDKPTVKSSSNLIKHFHKSMIYANIYNNLSPYDGWQLIKKDPEVFKNFYRNRLRCSDWFKEEGRLIYLLRGCVMEETYGIGLSTSRMYQSVTYFKPRLAKYIINKYLNNYNTIFDPFSGYSGRMLGAVGANKNYIGQDLCEASVKESNDIYNFIKPYINTICEINHKDSVKSFGKYECLFTCPPYENIENWPGVKSVNYTCDKWIDICLSNYDCEKYVFVTDDKLIKYKKYIVENISNSSHLKSNTEYIVVINKSDLKDIHLDIIGDTIDVESNSRDYTDLGINLYNIFNQQIFNKYIDCPSEFTNWIKLIYKKFNCELLGINNINLPKIKLNNVDNKVLLACSGGLDSTYQIFQLRDMGYEPIIYHLKGANTYESSLAYKAVLNISEKLNVKAVIPELHRNYNSNYSKYWAENPIKNQMILFSMIDYCKENNINKICMDGSWEFSINEVTAGVDVADAPENYDLWIEGIKCYVDNFEFIKTTHNNLSKFDKIKKLDSEGLMDYIISCLGSGRFNEYRHNKNVEKYNIKLFKNNCGCHCRKCAHHNLLMYYSGYRDFPEEFINKCWNIMNNNGFASRHMLFGDDIPLNEKIKNLFVE